MCIAILVMVLKNKMVHNLTHAILARVKGSREILCSEENQNVIPAKDMES